MVCSAVHVEIAQKVLVRTHERSFVSGVCEKMLIALLMIGLLVWALAVGLVPIGGSVSSFHDIIAVDWACVSSFVHACTNTHTNTTNLSAYLGIVGNHFLRFVLLFLLHHASTTQLEFRVGNRETAPDIFNTPRSVSTRFV